MSNRIAGVLALIAFAASLVAGMVSDNPFATTVARALLAMAGTYVIGLVLGAMGQRMIDENLKAQEEKLKNLQSTSATEGR
jgi:hypothetical protein